MEISRIDLSLIAAYALLVSVVITGFTYVPLIEFVIYSFVYVVIAFSFPILRLLKIPDWVFYILSLSTPCIGLGASILLWLAKYEFAGPVTATIVYTALFFLTAFLPIWVVKKSSVGFLRKMNIRKNAFGILSQILLALSFIFIVPFTLDPQRLGHSIILGVLWIGYLSFGMSQICEDYRRMILADVLGVSELDQFVSDLMEKLRLRFPNKLDSVELLQLYLRTSVEFFIGGDYEESFIWGYKIVREPTVERPTELVDDVIEGEKKRFSEIRTIIMHSRRRAESITVQDIEDTRKELFNIDLKLFKKIFEFLTKVSEPIERFYP